jgi:hypothetical protein
MYYCVFINIPSYYLSLKHEAALHFVERRENIPLATNI